MAIRDLLNLIVVGVQSDFILSWICLIFVDLFVIYLNFNEILVVNFIFNKFKIYCEQIKLYIFKLS